MSWIWFTFHWSRKLQRVPMTIIKTISASTLDFKSTVERATNCSIQFTQARRYIYPLNDGWHQCWFTEWWKSNSEEVILTLDWRCTSSATARQSLFLPPSFSFNLLFRGFSYWIAQFCETVPECKSSPDKHKVRLKKMPHFLKYKSQTSD